MSTGVLSKTRLNRLHDVMAGYVERSDLPGMVTLVSRRGEVQVYALGRPGRLKQTFFWKATVRDQNMTVRIKSQNISKNVV
jgi:hypothetical protein